MIKGFSDTLSSGLGAKGKDIKGLLTGSVSLLGKDADIFKLAFRMTLFKTIAMTMCLACVYYFLIAQDYLTGMLLILLTLMAGPVFSFIQMRYKAVGSWMIYDILQGKDTDIPSGARAIKGMGFSLFLYSMIDYLIKSKSSEESDSESNTGSNFFINLLFDVFSEVWDLVKNFSLPAIVIDQSTIRQIPEKLSLLKKNIPGALAGVLGIDLIGSLIGSLSLVLFLPALALGAGVGYLGHSLFPESWMILTENNEIVVNTLPIFILLFISFVLSSLFTSIVDIVKTSYFTTFYIALTRPDDIQEDLRAKVTHYLDYEGKTENYTFFKKQVPEDEKGYDLNAQTGDDQKIINRLANTFKTNINKGMAKEKIHQALLKKGYSKEQLDTAFKLYQAYLKKRKRKQP
ncbi:hypothetical protein [Endozoicomonas euniceicola]|uniref:RDD domain-containing protein n=1 Tax=Endozoicomonas euniceicola TaxID=1234143 RepID=A0ABY6GPM6_9GAMM|nr:hypothetical protein [Endozoicomonas euniceicola]UYM14655.1 hypothetical protein NX720_17400 [Endozoicomonas euniceicola]